MDKLRPYLIVIAFVVGLTLGVYGCNSCTAGGGFIQCSVGFES